MKTVSRKEERNSSLLTCKVAAIKAINIPIDFITYIISCNGTYAQFVDVAFH